MFLLLLACATDPLTAAGEAYMVEMRPLFTQNRALGEQLLQVASKVKKNEAEPATVAETVSGAVLKAAGEMATKAEAVHPADPQLAAAHTELVKAWKHRAEAYSTVSTAFAAKDTAGFDKAVAAVGAASDEEALAAEHLEKVLEPSGVAVDIYP
jgi:hypothetical protein